MTEGTKPLVKQKAILIIKLVATKQYIPAFRGKATHVARLSDEEPTSRMKNREGKKTEWSCKGKGCGNMRRYGVGHHRRRRCSILVICIGREDWRSSSTKP
jgi:hypothetical protein